LRKKTPTKLKGPKVSSLKSLTVVQCWVNTGSGTGRRNTAQSMDRRGQLMHWWVLVHSGPSPDTTTIIIFIEVFTIGVLALPSKNYYNYNNIY
jgi:hypothetical protein